MGKLSPLLREKLGLANPTKTLVRLVVEAKREKGDYVISQLREAGFSVDTSLISTILDKTYIPVAVPAELVPEIAKIEGVVMVHKSMPRAIGGLTTTKVPSPFSVMDELIGEVRIPAVEVPATAFLEALPNPITPLKALGNLAIPFTGLNPLTNIKIFPTSETFKIVKGTVKTKEGEGITVAVLDTGSPRYTTQFISPAKAASLEEYTVLPELPADFHGHGCVKGNTVVFTTFCGLESLEEIWDKVDAQEIPYKDGFAKFFNAKTVGNNGFVETNAIFKTESDESILIKSKIGEIETTTWHEFYVIRPIKRAKNRLGNPDFHPRFYNGYIIEKSKAEDLKVGDYLVMPRFEFDTKARDDDFILFTYIVGYILGDGNIRPYSDKRHIEVQITDKDKNRLEGVAKILKRLGYSPHIKERCVVVYSTKLRRALKQLEIPSGEDRSKKFRLPRKLLKNIEAVRAFVAGYFDAEGNIHKKGERLYFRIISVNKRFLEDLRELLLMFGIYSYIVSGGVSKGSKSYQLSIGVGSSKDFADMIRPYSLKHIPEIKDLREEKSKGVFTTDNKYRAIRIKEVVHKQYDTPQRFYSLSIPEIHSYVANGVLQLNSWCTNCVCGDPAPSPYGTVVGGAPKVDRTIHVKCLSTVGFGSTEGIIKAIDIAIHEGAQVLSLSLGGPAQGPSAGPDADLECKVVNNLSKLKTVLVIAAGNSGPGLFTCGTPGAALNAVTVGSVSIMDKFKPAYWSSRLQSDWYGKHRKEFERDLAKYGDMLIKPDCSSLGGGRASPKEKVDEVIWSGATGWFEGFYDGIKDGTCGMHGTSQATPTSASIIACLFSDGIVSNDLDVKRYLRETSSEYIIPDPLNTEEDNKYIARYGKSGATGWGLMMLKRYKK